jgi:hypothetical protein
MSGTVQCRTTTTVRYHAPLTLPLTWPAVDRVDRIALANGAVVSRRAPRRRTAPGMEKEREGRRPGSTVTNPGSLGFSAGSTGPGVVGGAVWTVKGTMKG